MPRFSIIITCFNQAGVITEAVDSALAQTCGDREIIVVDDGSSDGSVLRLRKYAGAITLETPDTNEGADRARNRGAALAQGDFLVFLDGDDRLLPWALDVYRRVADFARPKLMLANMHFYRGHLSAEAAGEIKMVIHADYFKKDRAFRASASAMIVDRAAFHAAGGWTDGTFPADDQDLLFKLGCSGPAVQIVAPKTSAYRIHEGNATREVRPLIEACHGLLARERQGRYPGGRGRGFDRYAVIGGFLFFLVKRAWRSRLHREAGKLLAAGWPMLVAATLLRCAAILRGRRPEKILTEFSPPT